METAIERQATEGKTMKAKIAGIMLALAGTMGQSVEASCTKPESPYLRLETKRSGEKLQMNVQSNICGRNTLMVGVDLAGQKDSDIWIGSTERTELVNGRAQATVDLSELPDGEYTADAFWGWRFPNDEVAKAQAPTAREVQSNQVRVRIRGTGVAADEAQRRENKQAELIGSLGANDPVPVDALAREFGPVEVLSKTRQRQTLYFKGLDMTFELTAQGRLRSYDMGRKVTKEAPSATQGKCPHGDEHNAWAFFQRAVEERMTNPGSADFPFAGGSRHLRKTGMCSWTVESWVEGTNGFGATVRQPFWGQLTLKNGGATLEALEFE